MIISMAISSPLQIVVVVDASLSHPPRSGPERNFAPRGSRACVIVSEKLISQSYAWLCSLDADVDTPRSGCGISRIDVAPTVTRQASQVRDARMNSRQMS
jgi:hypothetical protein